LLFHRVSNKNNEYDVYRKRLGQFVKIAQEKLGIKGWVIYPPNFKRKNYEKENPYNKTCRH
jgi:hypothetical protein